MLASRLGTSDWTETARLLLRLPDGCEERYFLKSAPGDHGRVMMKGEYNAMTELYKWAPDLVPKPHSWGKYALPNPEAYFFVAQYIDMTGNMPDANQLCSKLAALQRSSKSPYGQFGFHVTTCLGRVPQAVAWQRSWTVFFIQLLKHATGMDADLNGHWEGLDVLEKRLISHVIPRLLGALEGDGRTVKPSLIHSDLWEGNTAISVEDGNVYIFDSAAFYAHNEMEIGDWRCYYNKISDKKYTRAYLRLFGPSEPKEEWEDRNCLYSIYYNIIYSVNHLSQGKAVRQLSALLDVIELQRCLTDTKIGPTRTCIHSLTNFLPFSQDKGRLDLPSQVWHSFLRTGTTTSCNREVSGSFGYLVVIKDENHHEDGNVYIFNWPALYLCTLLTVTRALSAVPRKAHKKQFVFLPANAREFCISFRCY